jgi:hypothetical protein
MGNLCLRNSGADYVASSARFFGAMAIFKKLFNLGNIPTLSAGEWVKLEYLCQDY